MKEAIDTKKLDRLIDATLIEAKRVKTGTIRKSLQADKALADLRNRIEAAPKVNLLIGDGDLDEVKALLTSGIEALVALADDDKMPDLIAKQSKRRREIIEEALELLEAISPSENPETPFVLQGSEVK